MKRSLPLAAALLALAAPLAADSSVGVGVSTFGLNLEAQTRVAPMIGVRGAVMGGVDIDYEEMDAEVDLMGNVTLGGAALLVDAYPMGGGWRVSAGGFLTDSDLEVIGSAEITKVGTVSVTSTAEFANEISPMLTTGYVWNASPFFSLSTDVGLLYTGGIEVTYTANDPLWQDDVDADPELQQIRDDASEITIYPYASIVGSFRF